MKFPKEFKKRFYQGLEPRYVVILLSSLLIHFVLVLYLLSHFSKEDPERSVERARKHFARLLLEGGQKPPSTLSHSAERSPERYSNFRILDAFLDELQSYEAPIEELLDLPSSQPVETEVTSPPRRGATAEERTAERRRMSRNEILEDVQRIGLLGVITTGSGIVTYDEIADILAFADLTAADLEQRLSFLTSLRVPRNVRPGGGRGFRDLAPGSPAEPEQRTLRGGRVRPESVRVSDVVENLGEAKDIRVDKTLEYQQVSSSNPLDGLRSPTYANGSSYPKRREARDVRRVVMSHYPAIQDCYTQALKRDPSLKGKVVVRFVIAPGGHVADASVESTTISNQEMLDCIVSRILRWNDFPAIDSSADNMAVKQTYVFGL